MKQVVLSNEERNGREFNEETVCIGVDRLREGCGMVKHCRLIIMAKSWGIMVGLAAATGGGFSIGPESSG